MRRATFVQPKASPVAQLRSLSSTKIAPVFIPADTQPSITHCLLKHLPIRLTHELTDLGTLGIVAVRDAIEEVVDAEQLDNAARVHDVCVLCGLQKDSHFHSGS